MRRDYIEFQDRSFALAYLITFRCYGTWLHGDERGTVGRRGSNVFGSPRIRLDKTLLEIDKRQMAAPPFELGSIERSLVENAIVQVCAVRRYHLFALNVRTNHVHLVVSNGGNVERMMDSFKAYSTKAFRTAGLVVRHVRPWSRHGSTRYLWTEEHIATAVDYVLNRQGAELPVFD
jgi:REP element-mobilizing transposase RayT